jgi:protein ImuB
MFAAIYIPDFALQCVLRHEPELRDRALAVVDGALPARIRQMTPAARECGVSAGMTTTQALGRCPALLFRTVGESLLTPASALLLQCAESFSPWLEATGEGVVTLEWRGDSFATSECEDVKDARQLCAIPPRRTSGDDRDTIDAAFPTRARKKFALAGIPALGTPALPGTAPALPGMPAALQSFSKRAHAIVAQLVQCGFAAQVGVAVTPDLALLAAHAAVSVRVVEKATEFLAPLPIETLALDGEASCSEAAAEELQAAREEVFRLLGRWGIRTLGAFAALPREQVVARLGGLARELWDRAAGTTNRPLRLVRAPEIFAETMELEHEVETLEPLLFILRRFLEQLVVRLGAAYRVAAVLELRLTFRDGAPHVRDFRIPAPTRDVDVLFRVLSTHLESVTAEAPIVAVALSAQPARPEQQQFNLFESGLRDPNKFFETLARLHALLGNDRVGTPVAEDTHRPDAFHLETPRFDDVPAVAGVCDPGRAASGNGAPRKSPRPAGLAEAGYSAPTASTCASTPLQRYRPPLHADVQMLDGRPVRVFSEKAFGEVTDCRGPWLGSGDWWAERAWDRVEWDVQVGDTCYRLAQQTGAWFLDGAYD